MRAFSIRYAYNGGGNPIHRVEITLNGGMDWHVCRIKERERPHARTMGRQSAPFTGPLVAWTGRLNTRLRTSERVFPSIAWHQQEYYE